MILFTDWKYFVFFAAAFAVYWSLRNNALRKYWLLACSIAFYGSWDWRFLGLVFLVIANTYAVTLLIAASGDARWRKRILVTGMTLSLSVLGVFKYYNFFVDSLSQWVVVPIRIQDIVLPIGISFYTFHSLSYMIDTFRRNITPTRSFTDVALYILFFPQLVAGPIVRATDLMPQMREARVFSAVPFKYFLLMFLVGYFKKAVVSDNLSPFVDAFYAAPGNYGAADAAIASLFYAVQIYCDFSGYTDMAIASAGLLGYKLKPNFNFPYLASSPVEFWRRWHISLSLFLRDYLYIPLGGNRGGMVNQSRNILITMLLGGLWHGASWTFVVWGALHGIALVACHYWQDTRRRFLPAPGPGYTTVAISLTFLFATFAWIFFRSPSFDVAAAVLQRFSVAAPATLASLPGAFIVLALLLVVHIAFSRIDLQRLAARLGTPAFSFGYGAAVAAILPFVNVNVQPFIYFQF